MQSPAAFAKRVVLRALDRIAVRFAGKLQAGSVFAYLGDGVGLTRTHRGHKILVYTRDFTITPHIILDGLWEPWIEDAVLSLLRPGATVVEVGSNMGYHTLAMCEAIGPEGRLHGFEANPELFPLLKASVALNGFGPRASLYNLAVIDARQEVAFQYTPAQVGGASIVVTQPEAGNTVIRVPGVCLDETLAHLPRADMLRMDAEGSEPLIVKGARNLIERSPDIVVVSEWSVSMMSARVSAEDYLGVLAGFGFRSWRITEHANFAPITFSELLSAPLCEVLFSRQTPRSVERRQPDAA
jgi:FkbM family methyltransferase